MSEFLKKMAAASLDRARAARAGEPEARLRARIAALPPAPVLRRSPGGFDLIAEVKRRAPSAGRLAPGRRDASGAVAQRACTYESAGAAAVSVLLTSSSKRALPARPGRCSSSGSWTSGA